MTDTKIKNQLPKEQVAFIQHHLPGLDDGEYQLIVSQHVHDSKDKPISDDTLTRTYAFAVTGDRFALTNPASIVNAVFPADNAAGKFSTVLPHVVFTQKTFPWSRELTSGSLGKSLAPGADHDADTPTWLAVLLLDEDDLPPPAAGVSQPWGLTPKTLAIRDLFPPTALRQDQGVSSLGGGLSYFEGAKDASGLEIGETLDDPIQALDIPLSLFWQIAPTVADLTLLAHARKVDLVNKVSVEGVSDVGEPTGDFSIVFGARLPQTQRRATAYLVALEGLQAYLPTDEDGGPPTLNKFDGSRLLRLAVLTSWTFFSTGEAALFTDQLLKLNGAPRLKPTEAKIVNLRRDYGGANVTVQNALKMGYVPLNHELRTGGKTVSWYRGPLAPYHIGPSHLTFPITSPDAATYFDPTTGLFDVSYATAWTLGRMLALQDTGFATALYNWKKDQAMKAIRATENVIIQQTFGPLFQGAAPTAALLERRSAPSSKPLLHTLMQALAERHE